MRAGLVAAIGVAAMIGLTGPVLAEDPPQLFMVHGVTPDGTAYDGTGQLKQVFETGADGDVFAVAWTINGKQMQGMAITGSKQDTIAVSFEGPNGKPGIMIMVASGGAGASGSWLSQGDSKLGSETWTFKH